MKKLQIRIQNAAKAGPVTQIVVERDYVQSYASENFEARSDVLSRWAWLIVRGSKKWEVGIGPLGEDDHRAFVLEGFDRCALAALRWLRGENADAIVATSGPIWRHTWPVQ